MKTIFQKTNNLKKKLIPALFFIFYNPNILPEQFVLLFFQGKKPEQANYQANGKSDPDTANDEIQERE